MKNTLDLSRLSDTFTLVLTHKQGLALLSLFDWTDFDDFGTEDQIYAVKQIESAIDRVVNAHDYAETSEIQ